METQKQKKQLYNYLALKTCYASQSLYNDLKEIYTEMVTNNEDKYLKSLYKAMCKSIGLIEYKVSEFAEDTGISKNKVKILIKDLIDEGKLDKVVEHETTFLIAK